MIEDGDLGSLPLVVVLVGIPSVNRVRAGSYELGYDHGISVAPVPD